jgi:hypothetical protein
MGYLAVSVVGLPLVLPGIGCLIAAHTLEKRERMTAQAQERRSRA